MKKNRKPRNRHTQIYPTAFGKSAKTTVEEKKAFLKTNGIGTAGNPQGKKIHNIQKLTQFIELINACYHAKKLTQFLKFETKHRQQKRRGKKWSYMNFKFPKDKEKIKYLQTIYLIRS